MADDRVIITAALTGVLATREQCPAIPYTADELAQEARRAGDAGAAIVHIHAREADGAPSWRPELFVEIIEKVRQQSDVIVNFSTGGVGISAVERARHLAAAKPDIAALNMGSMNYAIYSRRAKQFHHDHVFQNSFADIVTFLTAMKKNGVLPELECFDTAHLQNAEPLIDMGLLTPPLHLSFVLGVLGGAPATVKSMMHMAELSPPDSQWQLVGVGRRQWRLIAGALAMGGHVRVGLEDNFYLPSGAMADGNGPLVEQAVSMCRDVGRPVASPAAARELLAIEA